MNGLPQVRARGAPLPRRRNLAPVQIAVIMYASKFISERRPVAQRWMNAYLKGCDSTPRAGEGCRGLESLADQIK